MVAGMRVPVWLFMTAFALPACAASGDDNDSAALALTGPGVSAMTAKALSLTTEAALTESALRAGGEANEERVSFDLRYDGALSTGLRVMMADRLDVDWLGSWDDPQQVNTLKEAYLSWQPQSGLLFDAGRINARQGVAVGYNPTDFLRANTLRSIDSLDPNSLRDERLGTVMLRGETLWDNGAFTALYAPKLADGPANGPFDADFGATNSRSHWLLSLSQRLIAGWTPQWLLFGSTGASPQVGVNSTAVLGSSTVAFLEASGGSTPSLWTQAQGLPDEASLRGRAAAGLTYSTANKLSVTFEDEYDGAALGRDAWRAARAGDPRAYLRYRDFVAAQQELPTQHSAFVYATWVDCMVRHLDLTAFVRVDLIDHSRLPWTELRYRWTHIDAALRWQDYQGAPATDFGASSTRQTWQLLLDYYL
jgi:hypothetical protein